MELEGRLPNEIIGCAGSGSNFTGSMFEFLDEPKIKKIVEAEETAALTNGTKRYSTRYGNKIFTVR